MKTLAELQERKAELEAKMAQQSAEIKATLLEIRAEIEPANLLKNAVSGFFKPSNGVGSGTSASRSTQLMGPLAILADLLVKDSRLALLLKLIAPVLINLLPVLGKSKAETSDENNLPARPFKAKVYGELRRNVSNIRKQLHKKEVNPPLFENIPDDHPEN
jgi:ABC-type multidrug transport system fused ATPase/permease subunit